MSGRNYTDGKSAEQLIGHIGFGGPVEVDTSSVKKVLITGAGSYIGESFSSYASNNYPALEINSIDMMDGSWREKDFSIPVTISGPATPRTRSSTRWQTGRSMTS